MTSESGLIFVSFKHLHPWLVSNSYTMSDPNHARSSTPECTQLPEWEEFLRSDEPEPLKTTARGPDQIAKKKAAETDARDHEVKDAQVKAPSR